MNVDETFQGCQHIALFMCWDVDRIRIYLTLKAPDMGKLAFNESWDLLMPVIEKIESLPTDRVNGQQYQFNMSADGINITEFDDGSGIVSQRVNEIGKSKLQSAFEVVATFCKEHLTP